MVRAPSLMHGKVSQIHHAGAGLFAGVPDPFPATRYHSLVVEPATLPASLEVTARTDDGVIMGLRHRDHPVVGVQFHPESIGTEGGYRILEDFLRDDRRAARIAAVRGRRWGTSSKGGLRRRAAIAPSTSRRRRRRRTSVPPKTMCLAPASRQGPVG